MSLELITSKTESKSFGFIVSEHIKTTLSLFVQKDGEIGLGYDCQFKGIKDGHVTGGPIAVHGNMAEVVNTSPKVKVNIQDFSHEQNKVSMHVVIIVDIPVIGQKKIFNQVLSGKYSSNHVNHECMAD